MDIYVREGNYTGKVQGVVLDWAGTSVDHGCIGPVAVFVDVFKRFRVEVTIQEARGPMGLMKKDHIREMCRMESVDKKWRAEHGRAPDENDIQAMYELTEPMMVEGVARHSIPIEGAVDFLKTMRERGIKIGSSTGYTGSIMEPVVKEAAKHGFAPDSIVSSTDVPAGRPYPWMCYQNAMNLGIYPFESMVKIGDTLSDIQEGLNAGMWVIALTRTGNELGLNAQDAAALDKAEMESRLNSIAERWRAAGAHYTAESIAHCPPIIEEINERLARGERPY